MAMHASAARHAAFACAETEFAALNVTVKRSPWKCSMMPLASRTASRSATVTAPCIVPMCSLRAFAAAWNIKMLTARTLTRFVANFEPSCSAEGGAFPAMLFFEDAAEACDAESSLFVSRRFWLCPGVSLGIRLSRSDSSSVVPPQRAPTSARRTSACPARAS